MLLKRFIVTALTALGAWQLAHGEDFNQWRGPQRNGLTFGGSALDIHWGKAGPAKIWESEAIPGALENGSGCISVSGGKVYVYLQWTFVDSTTRMLTDANLRHLGWTDRKRPTDLVHGTNAMPLDLLAKLATIRNKEFPNQTALDAWFADNGFPDEQKAAVQAPIPTAVHKSWDTLICLNATDGKTLWKKQYDGAAPYGSYPYGASSTPTVTDGRCYFCGSKNDVYCLDAATGAEIWHFNTPATRQVINHSSPLVTDGLAIVVTGELVALDPAKGTVIWRQPKVNTRENSPVVWRSDDRAFLLCNTPYATATVHCVDAADGRIVWSVPGGGRSSPTVVGDVMVTPGVIGKFVGDPTRFGLIAYKLSPGKAEKLWATEQYSRGDEGAVIYDGHVYAFGPGVAACLELATGKVNWEQKKTAHRGVRSPVLADGKIITSTGVAIQVIRATPEKYDVLGETRLPLCEYASPAVADGRLYLRQLKNVACYDLTRPTATKVEEAQPTK